MYGEELISIIIPAYNCENTIERCLNSILRQTYRNFEVIVINDGSLDLTAKKIESYSDSRIKLFSQENKGVSVARNQGISLSKGKYIAFIDSDDSVHEMYLEQLIKLSREVDFPVVNYAYREGERGVLHAYEETNIYQKSFYELSREYFVGNIGRKISFSVWNKLFIKDYLVENNIQFDEMLSMGEDMLFVFQYLCVCKSVKVYEMPVYYYLFREDSAINSKDIAYKYEKTYRKLKNMHQGKCRIQKQVLERWALNIMPYILLNKDALEVTYIDFKIYYENILTLEVTKAALQCSEKTDIKKSIIKNILKIQNAGCMYILLHIYRFLMKTKWR